MSFERRRSLNWLFAYMGGNLLTVQSLTLMSYICYIRIIRSLLMPTHGSDVPGPMSTRRHQVELCYLLKFGKY